MLKKIYRYSQSLLSSFTRQSLEPSSSLIPSLTRVIIGNGVAGIEAAKTLRKLDQDCRIIVISEESVLHWSRPALMYIFMEDLSFSESCPYPQEWFTQKRIELVQDRVVGVDRSQQRLSLKNRQALFYDQLLVACGSHPITLAHIPIALDDVLGFYHLQDGETLKQKTQHAQHALIIGGGLIAVELAEVLIHQGLQVDVVTQDPLFAAHILPTEEAKFLTDYLVEQGIRLHCLTQVEKLLTLEQDAPHDSDLESQEPQLFAEQDKRSHSSKQIHSNPRISQKQILLSNGDIIHTELILMAIGVEPSIKRISGLEDLSRRGLVVNHKLQSIDPNIFAAGDCAERILHSEHSEQVGEQAALPHTSDSLVSGTWYEAKAMGKVVAHSMHRAHLSQDLVPNLAQDQSEAKPQTHLYQPLVHQWFNSARFFEIEYQEYGQCLNSLQRNRSDLNSCYYLNYSQKKSLRLIYKDQVFTGICSLGIRLRQVLCQTWLEEKKSVLTVIESLHLLGFDPEFDTSINQAKEALLKQYKSKINADLLDQSESVS